MYIKSIVMEMKAEMLILVTVIQINIRMHKHHPNLSPRNCVISRVKRESRVKKKMKLLFFYIHLACRARCATNPITAATKTKSFLVHCVPYAHITTVMGVSMLVEPSSGDHKGKCLEGST